MAGQELMRDKNKSAFKLQGLPHIYWLNLDADVKRREYMENQFDYWEIENHTRISGYDGRAKYVDLMYERYDLFLYNVVEPKLAEQFQFKEFEENDYNLFPINNDSNNSQHTLKYLLRKSIRLKEQIIGAEIRLQKLFEKLDEDLKPEVSNH